jgi:pyruvate,orthophosphate dikinase
MLGHRGCRLGVTYPEIYEMQARAIFEAACDVAKEGRAPDAGSHDPAGRHQARARPDEGARRRGGEGGDQPSTRREVDYLVGTMIELPRAALRAGEIAEGGEFFSFGTNDLTQTTLGISRDDAGRFLGAYVAKGIYREDPFVTLDQEGVGELVRMAARARPRHAPRTSSSASAANMAATRPPSPSARKVGLDYVSCSPFRVPIAA